MNFNEYQQETVKTAIYRTSIRKYVESLGITDSVKKEELIDLLNVSYVIMGLAGEAGELAGKMKKVLRDGEGDMDKFREDMLKENGDCTWYNSRISFELNENYETTAINNLNKLTKRKENGTITGSGDNR